jgi:UDP-glucose 4-epimerase
MKIEGSRILVTGGAGLVGSNIVDQLIGERPEQIIAFDKHILPFAQNRDPKLDYRSVTFREGDITRLDEVRKILNGIDFVVHTASLLGKEANKHWRSAFEVNICGTFNLLEQSVASKVKKFVYSSSDLVYGHSGDATVELTTEEHPFNPDSLYGVGKVASEMLLRLFNKKEELDCIALRYSPIYGPRQTGRANIAQHIVESFERINLGLPPLIYGDGSQLYDYIYAEDVARANILALKSSVSGESFNIATGVATSVADVVRIIREITETSLEAEYVSQGERFRMGNMFLDVTKAEKMLGFKAAVSLREGLSRFLPFPKLSSAT